MVDVLAAKSDHPVATAKLRAVLRSPDVDETVRVKVLVDFAFDSSDVPLLTRLSDEDSVLGFHALKTLADVAPADAVGIARKTLDDRETLSDVRLSGAFKVIVRSAQFTRDASLRTELIARAGGVLGNPNASASAKESATFALAESRSMRAFRVILAEQSDPVMVAGAVDENAGLLVTTLQSCADADDVETAARALLVHPIIELATPLRACAAKLGNEQIIKLASRVAERTADEGSPLNTKWGKD